MEFVGREPFPDSGICESQLIELGGEEAFRFLARIRGEALATEAWDWDEDAAIDLAVEALGEPRIRELRVQDMKMSCK
jgi:hypothetical protein